MQYIDLSVTLENDKSWAPWWARNKVKYQGHRFGVVAVGLLLKLAPKYLKSGLGWANEEIIMSSHGTTHLDAPWHYAPECGGKPAKTIDEIPLEWCFSDGIVIDMRHKGDKEAITAQDLEEALGKTGAEIKPGDIVLIMTGSDKMLGTPEYFTKGTGMTADATKCLINKGVKVMGIDAWGWDRPLPFLAAEAKRTGNRELFWEAHYVGMDMEYCHLERLTNLDKLPSQGFKVACFPVKIKKASAGPARVVAMIDD